MHDHADRDQNTDDGEQDDTRCGADADHVVLKDLLEDVELGDDGAVLEGRRGPSEGRGRRRGELFARPNADEYFFFPRSIGFCVFLFLLVFFVGIFVD